MNIADYLKLVRFSFLLAFKKPPYRGRVQRNAVSAGGLRFDCFEPDGQSRSVIIALHGGTVNGKDDIRLQHFATCLAASGTTCILPTLPGLARFQWSYADIDNLVDLVGRLAEGRVNVGLIGFSYGGSYALLTAANQKIAEHIEFVLSFGAYYALDDLARRQMTLGRTRPQQTKLWDNWLYLQLVMAQRNADQISLPDPVRALLNDLLARYCHAATLEEKQAFFQDHLSNYALVDIENSAMDAMRLKQLSPMGKLAHLKCPVGLIHDQTDSLVPARHAFQIAQELAEHNISHDILVTNLLDHVTVSNLLNLPHWYRLATLLLPVVRHQPKEAQGG